MKPTKVRKLLFKLAHKEPRIAAKAIAFNFDCLPTELRYCLFERPPHFYQLTLA